MHIRAIFSEKELYNDVIHGLHGPPGRTLMKLIKDTLSQNNESYYIDEIKAFERDCRAKLETDIAGVIVIINSPTFSRIVTNVKVSYTEKLANFGKFYLFIATFCYGLISSYFNLVKLEMTYLCYINFCFAF